MKKNTKGPTRTELLAAAHKIVPDVIAPNLTVLFVGINPGLYTAFIGHHFGRPGNRFWKALYESGFTPRQFDPSEKDELLKLGFGITNVVERASARADELSRAEQEAGATILREKVARYKPKWIAVLGVQAYRIGFQRPDAQVGLQPETIGETRIWVLPNPSGLNAHYTPGKLAEVFAMFRASI